MPKYDHHNKKRDDGIDPEFFVSSFYISVAIKVRLLKFNMFNRY